MNDLKLYGQFQKLSLSFPKLRLQRNGKGPWFVRGLIEFCADYSGCVIEDEYAIEMVIFDEYPDVLPKIFEIGHRIPKTFHHLMDDSLCLGAPLAIKQKFKIDPTLLGFIENCAIPYLYSFSYKSKYGKMPFGELSHNGLGILEYYQELFNLKDNRLILKFIQLLAGDSYRDEDKCLCGSGKRNKVCHGKTLLEIKALQSPAEFQVDFYTIVRDLIELAERPPFYRYPIMRTLARWF